MLDIFVRDYHISDRGAFLMPPPATFQPVLATGFFFNCSEVKLKRGNTLLVEILV